MICQKCNKEYNRDKAKIKRSIALIAIMLVIIVILIVGFIAVESADLSHSGTDSQVSFVSSEAVSSSTNSAQEFNEYLYKMNAGNACVDAGEYDEAVGEYQDAIELEPSTDSAYIGLANAYELSGNHDKAVSTLEEAYNSLGSQSIKKRLDQLNQE